MTQSDALSILKLGHTTFLTGPAGSGKSFILREYINYLKKHNIKYAVTASTGIASTHINGVTIHSWSGLGVRDYLSDYDLDALEEKQSLYKKYNETKVVIIDEVSMLSSNFLDMFDKLCRHMRRSECTFGGMQIIFCGDFFQLPPIIKSNSIENSFAYNSQSWKSAKPVICYLTEQHRQEDDVLTSILKQIRSGEIDDFIWNHLETSSVNKFTDGDHIKLYTHNVDVDAINNEAFAKLNGEEKSYQMTSKGKAKLVNILKNNCLADEELKLKKGAKVICIKNDLERKYVNGSMGVVFDFDENNMPIIELINGKRIKMNADSWKIEEDGKVKAEIIQLPLKLAWAITIHKSQGMTLDRAEIDLSRAFVSGMGYVALSRLKSISGLYLRGVHQNAFNISEDVREQDLIFQNKSIHAEKALKKYKNDDLQKLFERFIKDCDGQIEDRSDEEIYDEEMQEKKSTISLTKELIEQGKSLKETADIRKVTIETILGHLEKLKDSGEKINIEHILPTKKDVKIITQSFKDLDTMKLTPVFEELNEKYNYQTLRLVRLILK